MSIFFHHNQIKSSLQSNSNLITMTFLSRFVQLRSFFLSSNMIYIIRYIILKFIFIFVGYFWYAHIFNFLKWYFNWIFTTWFLHKQNFLIRFKWCNRLLVRSNSKLLWDTSFVLKGLAIYSAIMNSYNSIKYQFALIC